MLRFCLCVMIYFSTHIFAETPSSTKIRTIYNSLRQDSISQHLAFYELYPNTPEGQKSLAQVWNLLTGTPSLQPHQLTFDPIYNSVVKGVVALVNKQPDEPIPSLGDQELKLIEKLGSRLSNRQLKGHYVKTEAEVLQLPVEEIDLARGLFLTQMGSENFNTIRSYEAQIDLMALQILARLSLNATPAEKIRVMNDFIFSEMGFRFPPHSIYAQNIDVYTFLPSVLDSRRGVCLGVSILYICLAQRLNLQLEMITPPGHIYVRYRAGKDEINIETTARGINIHSEEYLGIDTRSLQQRTIKEVIGLAHFNQASVHWGKERYAEARASYEKAFPYLPDDKLLAELMAYSYLLTGDEEKGRVLLEKVKDHIPEHSVDGNTVAADILNGKVGIEGIKAMFMEVDETRASIIKKQLAIQEVLKKYPNFRSGWMALAAVWLQLHRNGEALETLKKYHELHEEDPTAEYYMAVLYAERLDYPKSWEHLRKAEKIVKAREHNPKVLIELRRQLATLSPE